MANCFNFQDATKVRNALVTINQEPKKDDSTQPPTYTFPVGAITKVAGHTTAELDRNANRQLGLVACCIAVCSTLIGIGIGCLIKR